MLKFSINHKKNELNSKEKKRKELIHDIKLTQAAMNTAYSNFENVVDVDLIDCYIYELQAIQKRYHFLLTLMKQLDNSHI